MEQLGTANGATRAARRDVSRDIWAVDATSDRVVASKHCPSDTVHDFDPDFDVIDVSGYGFDFAGVEARMTDHGWATQLDLGDAVLILKAIAPGELDESNFIL